MKVKNIVALTIMVQLGVLTQAFACQLARDYFDVKASRAGGEYLTRSGFTFSRFEQLKIKVESVNIEWRKTDQASECHDWEEILVTIEAIYLPKDSGEQCSESGSIIVVHDMSRDKIEFKKYTKPKFSCTQS